MIAIQTLSVFLCSNSLSDENSFGGDDEIKIMLRTMEKNPSHYTYRHGFKPRNSVVHITELETKKQVLGVKVFA